MVVKHVNSMTLLLLLTTRMESMLNTNESLISDELSVLSGLIKHAVNRKMPNTVIALFFAILFFISSPFL
ncbi:MAG: hypothetical protein R3C26_14155 [Calditrichia bacterium]